MGQISRFLHGATPESIRKLNELVDVGNAVINIRGDRFIKVQYTPGSLTLRFDYNQIFTRGGGAGKLPVPQFTGQIATGLDNTLVYLFDVYVPALPT